MATDEVGGFVRPQSVSSAGRKLIRQLGLLRIRLHDLRHTHATLASESGVHPEVVSGRLGHANVGITLTTPTISAGRDAKNLPENDDTPLW